MVPELRIPGRNLSKADVLLYRVGGRRIALKDYGARPFLARHTVGRLLVERECRAYQHADEAPGLAPFLGRIGPFALATAWIESVPLADLPRGAASGVTFDRLDEVIGGLHAEGRRDRRSSSPRRSRGQRRRRPCRRPRGGVRSRSSAELAPPTRVRAAPRSGPARRGTDARALHRTLRRRGVGGDRSGCGAALGDRSPDQGGLGPAPAKARVTGSWVSTRLRYPPVPAPRVASKETVP